MSEITLGRQMVTARLDRRVNMSRRSVLLALVLTVGLVVAWAAVGDQDERALWGRFTSTAEVIEFGGLSAYGEAPELKALVDAGEIPPLEERLPAAPAIWKTNIMVDGLGVYGDLFRLTYGTATQGWTMAAGNTAGWGGTNIYRLEGLVRDGPMWMMESTQPIPNLAESWEWSDDGMTLTMYLMEGVKWADGMPFTAEDVRFTYEDLILDEFVPSCTGSGQWTYAGIVTELEVVDDYTIKWHFGAAFPIKAFFEMSAFYSMPIAPAHINMYYHPKYNSEATYESLLSSRPPENLPDVVLGAFVPVAYEPGQQAVYVRNPYYWRVDEAGNQLPYLSEVLFTEAQSWNNRTLNTLAGSCDLTILQDPTLVPTILEAAQDPDFHADVHWGNFVAPVQLEFNLSLHAGVGDENARALRELFRDVEFRRAASHLIDRSGIAEGLFPGGFTRPFYGGYPHGSDMYNEDYVVKYEYDVAVANALLDGLGLVDTDGDGIRNWPEDTVLAGQELSIEVLIDSMADRWIQVVEAMMPMFEEGGIDLNLRVLESGIYSSKRNAGEWEATIGRPTQTTTPFTSPGFVGPISASTPAWHLAGPGGERNLMSFETVMGTLLEATATMASAEDRQQSFEEILKLYTENVYTVGLYQTLYIDLWPKRFRNRASDYPVYLYQWDVSNVPVSILWTAPEDQLTTQYSNLIPTPETYRAQAWYAEAVDWYLAQQED